MNVKSFEDASLRWESGKAGYIKDKSLAAYSLIIRAHLLPQFKRLEDVTPESFQALVDSKFKDGLSFNSVKAIILVLKMIIRFCEDEGWMEPKVYRIKTPPHQRKINPQVLTLKNEKHLLSWLHNHPAPYNVGLLICAYCGLRIGEVCALRWSDFDKKEKILHVRRAVHRIYLVDQIPKKSILAIGPPKTADSWRDVPVAARLVRSIEEGCPKGEGDPYLLTGNRFPADPQNVRNQFKRVCRLLEISACKVHGLRHTFATRCIESRCDFKTLSSILGHSDVSTTLNIYVHPDMDQKRRVVERMVKNI
ncbi:MAG: site-specific integrase [Bacteroidales bacterium]|nr:site-specific integrase [Bacteroidales bacterium]